MRRKMLHKKFTHRAWFINCNITRKQAIEYFACNSMNFILKQKPSKNQSENLLGATKYEYVIYCLEDGRSWKINNEEVPYYLSRLGFYEEFGKTHSFSERFSIPEYQEFLTACNS